MRYFEDITPGEYNESPMTYELTKEEIIEFCSKWDSQPFHTNEEAAAQTPVGKLFTSAIHTVAIAIRLGHEMREEPLDVVIGLGWDEVRFHTPACAGDTFRMRAKVIDTRVSESKPDIGIVRSQLELINQNDETVITFKTAALVRRRPQ